VRAIAAAGILDLDAQMCEVAVVPRVHAVPHVVHVVREQVLASDVGVDGFVVPRSGTQLEREMRTIESVLYALCRVPAGGVLRIRAYHIAFCRVQWRRAV
jgi:hypothetical protein